MLKRILVLIAVLTVAPWAEAVPMDQEKHRDIEKLVQMTGTLQNATAVLDRLLPQMIDLIRKANPEIPQQVLDLLAKDGKDEFHKALPELVEPIIAIYDANYSADEVRQLLAFYQSPLGRKMIDRTPQITQQSIAVGNVWGTNVGERVAQRIRASAKQKGYDL
jgi:uncharacterized protein